MIISYLYKQLYATKRDKPEEMEKIPRNVNSTKTEPRRN